ncbi:DJ-1/PfpI family protein [Streptomyces sp. NPDC058200]|uniref:DJ-1/PfpI family protein n=1 Tax=Streptomyces sp. NPDC058200 TaxID=3346378 RepID=UPI0036E9A37D
MLAQIVLFDGFDPLDVVAPYEVLFAGGVLADGALTVELVSAEGARDVPSGTGPLSLRATGVLDPARADLIVVPGASGRLGERDGAGTGDGAGASVDSVLGVDSASGDPASSDTIPAILARTLETGLPSLLKEACARPGLTVATVCGGSMILAMAGLLAGRHATTHHLGLDGLTAAGAVAVDARVVDDGDLVTGAGVTSGLDLGLYLLERELGPRIALGIERLFAYERRGTVWHHTGLAPASHV